MVFDSGNVCDAESGSRAISGRWPLLGGLVETGGSFCKILVVGMVSGRLFVAEPMVLEFRLKASWNVIFVEREIVGSVK